MNNFKKNLFSAESAILVGFFILFVMTSPFTVQSADTGELVTNAYFLRVNHPPGYPLWNLIYHLPVRFLPISTPFHIASIITSLISVTWLGLLLFKFRNVASRCLIIVLGTSLVFWRYSVLPDVFSLHLLFLVLVFIAFIEPDVLENPWMVFLISLCVAHHHTIVFVFPMYAYAVFQGNLKKKMILSIIFGFFSAFVYFSLFLFHPDDYGSWGSIKSVSALIDHFLRVEYGTFSLTAKKDGSDPVWLHFLLKNLIVDCWSLILALAFIAVKGWNKLKKHLTIFSILILSLSAFLITFLTGGVISLNGFGETIFERFLLQPILMLFFFVLLGINRAQIEIPKWIVMAFLVNAGLNITQNFNTNDFSDNTSIEDFSLNIFNSLPPKSIYYSYGDTQGGASYYLHDVMNVRPDLIHLHATLTNSWGIEKAALKYPQAINSKFSNIIEGVNFNDFNFYLNIPPNELPEYYKATVYGIIFKVTKDSEKRPSISYECDISKNYKFRNRSELKDYSNVEVSRFYDLEYGRCDYMFALEMIKVKKYTEAKQILEKSMDLARYSVRFLERLCYLYTLTNDPKLRECHGKLEEFIAISNKQYYLYQYEN